MSNSPLLGLIHSGYGTYNLLLMGRDILKYDDNCDVSRLYPNADRSSDPPGLIVGILWWGMGRIVGVRQGYFGHINNGIGRGNGGRGMGVYYYGKVVVTIAASSFRHDY